VKITDILYLELMLGFVGLTLALNVDPLSLKLDFILLFGIQLCFTGALMIKSKAWDKGKKWVKEKKANHDALQRDKSRGISSEKRW
jgi:hypothetical protein